MENRTSAGYAIHLSLPALTHFFSSELVTRTENCYPDAKPAHLLALVPFQGNRYSWVLCTLLHAGQRAIRRCWGSVCSCRDCNVIRVTEMSWDHWSDEPGESFRARVSVPVWSCCWLHLQKHLPASTTTRQACVPAIQLVHTLFLGSLWDRNTYLEARASTANLKTYSKSSMTNT